MKIKYKRNYMKKQLSSLVLLASISINTFALHELYNPEIATAPLQVAAPSQKVEREQSFFEKRFHNKNFLIRHKQADGSVIAYDLRKIFCINMALCLTCTLFKPSWSNNQWVSLLGSSSLLGATLSGLGLLYKDPKGTLADLAVNTALLLFITTKRLFASQEDVETIIRKDLYARTAARIAQEVTQRDKTLNRQSNIKIAHQWADAIKDDFFNAKCDVLIKHMIYCACFHYLASSAYTGNLLPWEYEEASHNQSVTQ